MYCRCGSGTGSPANVYIRPAFKALTHRASN
jgi:hypothetical protein